MLMKKALEWLSTVVLVAALCAPTPADEIEVIYTEISGDPSATVPGTKDASGLPVFAEFYSIGELALRHDGGEWVIKASSTLDSTLDQILILGSSLVGDAFAQDGQPFQGGVAGEQYDFFDTPVPAAWDEYGNIGFSARAKGGDANTKEKIVVYDGVTHTIVIQMGDPALGLIDLPPNPSGDELFGNSMNSVHLLNSGEVGFVCTPLTNCHSYRYPAFFHGNKSFRQSGVSSIEEETWDNFDYDDCGGTPDGVHWFAKGDTENPDTNIDNILAVDDQIALQEGFPVAGSAVIMDAVFFTRMLSDGTWFCRGDDPSDNDWAVRNDVLLAKTGDPISDTENWGAVFTAFTGNRVGDWLLAGNTDNPDPDIDNVLVLNGSEIVARENDPIDLDGDGQFNDDVYINSFQPNDLHLTDDRMVYFLATLRNGVGTSLGDAFLRMQLPPAYALGDLNCDGMVNGFDIDAFVLALNATPPDYPEYYAVYPDCDHMLADINQDGLVNGFDIDAFVALLGG
ncbi:MAG: hypothetical protein KKB50_16000 [Planctomycetes bacterium]|nr:hypothetical protein [Planctomycetota bacterium]